MSLPLSCPFFPASLWDRNADIYHWKGQQLLRQKTTRKVRWTLLSVVLVLLKERHGPGREFWLLVFKTCLRPVCHWLLETCSLISSSWRSDIQYKIQLITAMERNTYYSGLIFLECFRKTDFFRFVYLL